MRIPPSHHTHRPIPPAATHPTPVQIARDYKKGFDATAGYKQVLDPEKDPSLKGTKALALYKATLGEGRNLDQVTDGDHLVYRGKTGEVYVATFPEDSSCGDGLWVYDKTGNKLIGHGEAIDGHLKWDK